MLETKKVTVGKISISFEREGPFMGTKTLFVPIGMDNNNNNNNNEMVYDIDTLAMSILNLAYRNNVEKINIIVNDSQLDEIILLCGKLREYQTQDEYIPLLLVCNCYSSYAIALLIPMIDIVAIELKSASIIDEVIKSLHYLYISYSIVNYYIKIVISDKREYDSICSLFNKMNEICSYLNNDNKFLGVYIHVEDLLSVQDYSRLYDIAKEYFEDVRIFSRTPIVFLAQHL